MGKSHILLATTTVVLFAAPSLSIASGCDGYPLQSRGSSQNGYVCRCTYGPNGVVDWWAVIPGSGTQAPVRCSPPLDRSAPPTFTAQDEQQRHNQQVQSWQSLQRQRQSEVERQQRIETERRQQDVQSRYQSSRSVTATRTPTRMLRPSYSHRSVIRKSDTERITSGLYADIYSVEVTNTGNVSLSCTFTVKGVQWLSGGGYCANHSNCTGIRSSSGTSLVKPGRSSIIASLSYYSGQGSYQGNCRAAPEFD
jgi:hypothetical protein